MKKNKIYIKLLIAGVLVLSIFPACNKDYFDINQNPNSPADASVRELLPSAEAAIAHVVGNNFQIWGGLWAQYWTQSPSSSQYKTFEQYSPKSDDFDRPWKALYADALMDLKTIDKKAMAAGLPNYAACARILEAYTFQILTDNFGDIPFSEALRADELILNPRYDSQQDVYDGIINLVNSGLALIDETSILVPGADDLLLGGDMALWRKFGNTLKLKIYLRLAYVDPGKAAAGIAALETSAAEFLGAGEEVKINYINSGGNSNPLYSSIIDLSFVQNLVASATAIDSFFLKYDDSRVDMFYTPPGATQLGIPQGAYTMPAGTPVSLPSTATGGYGTDEASATAPVKLMTGYESLFLQAEATARLWLSGGNDQALYDEGIIESFASYGLTPDTDSVFVAMSAYPTSTMADKIKAIITQKWAAMCGNQNDEAWIEWRRTGYPDFFSESVNTIIGGGRFPQRFFYPSTEVTRNISSFPGQKLIYDKVWWDVN